MGDCDLVVFELPFDVHHDVSHTVDGLARNGQGEEGLELGVVGEESLGVSVF